MSYLYILLTIALTVYGQLVIKWQVVKFGAIPAGVSDKFLFLFHLLTDFWIISGLLAAFLASLTWMMALSKLPLSYAYPFMSLSFVFVVFLSGLILNEPITYAKIIGLIFIVLGVYVVSLS